MTDPSRSEPVDYEPAKPAATNACWGKPYKSARLLNIIRSLEHIIEGERSRTLDLAYRLGGAPCISSGGVTRRDRLLRLRKSDAVH